MRADIEWFEELDSTNDYVRRQVEQRSLFPPATVAAKKQTAGRGRGGNRWWSPDGCLMFTSLLDSGTYTRDLSQLPQAALIVGVAIADLLSQYIEPEAVQLKWPNDVYVRGRKIAGILVEGISSSSASLPHQPGVAHPQTNLWWMVGVGLNLTMDWSQAPAEVQQRATCLATECGISFPGEAFLPQAVTQIEKTLLAWRMDPLALFAHFRARCYLSGKLIEVQQGSSCCRGICQGIDDSGRLLLASETGVRPISSGSISVLSGEGLT